MQPWKSETATLRGRMTRNDVPDNVVRETTDYVREDLWMERHIHVCEFGTCHWNPMQDCTYTPDCWPRKSSTSRTSQFGYRVARVRCEAGSGQGPLPISHGLFIGDRQMHH